MTNLLDDNVAIVTGGGRGIGREIALLMARQGAKVLVNDVGSEVSGEGSDKTPAEEVVQVIRAEGGIAAANGESVESWDGARSIIQSALDTFGRLDCVINNAGILRDRIFHKMSVEEFESVIRVHLMGSFYVSRAAAPHFRERSSGSFVHMTSTSGLVGNVGQANYAAAKLGIVGLSRSIALDMQRFNVRSNCISPFAWSRMIGSIPTNTDEQKARVERLKTMTPAKVAPVAVVLASKAAADITGQIIAVRSNEIFLMSQSRPLRSIHRSEGWTPESLSQQMPAAFKSDFYPLDVSADVFSWDPI